MQDLSESEALKKVKELLELRSVRESSQDTDLFHDLGLDGADAEEVFKELQEDHGVDLGSLQWDRHFGPEAAFNPFALLFPSWWRWRRQRIPVRVRDLVEAIRTKRWQLCYPEK